jgi:hypothetical protein
VVFFEAPYDASGGIAGDGSSNLISPRLRSYLCCVLSPAKSGIVPLLQVLPGAPSKFSMY